VSEVQQACRDHYAKGLDVDCHSFITSTNTAIKQRGGELFNDPSGKNPTAAEKAGEKMCTMTGKRLRAAVAKGASTAPAPGCVELGGYLDGRCFTHIGTSVYNDHCTGPLLLTKKVDSDATCTSQLAAARQLLE